MHKWNSQKFKALIFFVAISIYGCSANMAPRVYYSARNTGDRIASNLKLGMTMEEIAAIVANSDQKAYVTEGPPDSIQTEDEVDSLYRLYVHYPRDLLKDVRVGTKYRTFSFWIAAHSQASIFLFFDEEEKLRGWANDPSQLTLERYWHERLTAKLKYHNDHHRGMSRSEVYALIGPPTEIIAAPPTSRALFDDHYWAGFGFIETSKPEVYTYALSNGAQRRVYLIYYPAKDELMNWGYDQAWEEGERYLSEFGAQQK